MDSATGPTQSPTEVCSYQLHVPSTLALDSSSLSNLAAEILAHVQSLSRDYIWHKQPFNLSLSALSFADKQDQAQWLHGKTEVTDAVDDEWFIVWLLRELSKRFDQVIVGVEDDDGEFLLIEAAEVLPKWITPNNAANRVWIHQGRLHLIPLEYISPIPLNAPSSATAPLFEEEGYIDRNAAIELVRDPKIDTLALPEVEQAVWNRINGYPGRIREHLHQTLAYLPIDVALALSDSPALAAEAISAFYEREPSTLKACNLMTRFPPSSPLDALVPSTSTSDLPGTVLVPTTLTRPLYSQLVMQRFFPPKSFDKVNWSSGQLGEEDERRRSVGMKIACGFEMLYSTTSRLSRPLDPSSSFDASSDPKYQTFIRSLTKQGYFENEIPGSTKYQRLESRAKEGWLHARSTSSDLGGRKLFAERVEEAIARAKQRGEREVHLLGERVTSILSEEKMSALEDDEGWLAMDEQGLEDLLQSRGPGGRNGLDDDLLDDSDEEDEADEGMDVDEATDAEGKKAAKAAKKLSAMAQKVEQFVEGRGTVEGATFSDEESEDDEDEEEMGPEERQKRLATLVEGLQEGEWGAKSKEEEENSTAPPPLKGTTTILVPSSRPPKLTQNKYDGASSDDESSDEEANEGEEGLGMIPGMEGVVDEGENAPAIEMDMQEEVDEFLKFATETLGLTPEQYQAILKEREGRGAFVPGPPPTKKVNIIPLLPDESSVAKERSAPIPAAPTVPNPPLRNPNLSDFDALMSQMDSELAKARHSTGTSRSTKSSTTSTKPESGRSKAPGSSKQGTTGTSRVVVDSGSSDEDDEDEANVAAMDEELASLFHQINGSSERDTGPVDLNLVKNFLESFQSQGGFAGPAGNLSGRLGYPLPRNLGDKE